MKQPNPMLKLVAATTSLALVGAYVGYRVLRADSRAEAPVSAAPPASAPPAAAADPVFVPEDLLHMGGSKSMMVIEPKDLDPKALKPDAPQVVPTPPAK